MFNISDNDQLFKVHPFRIERKINGKVRIIWIDVYEHMNSTSETKYHALPIDKPLTLERTKAKYVKDGDTLEDALNSCLSAIAGLEHSELFEKKRNQK